MQVSLRLKLSAAFLAVTLLLFLIVGVLANALLDRQFKSYVIETLQKRIDDTVSLIASRYNDWGSKWDVAGIETIGVNALGSGLILKVADQDGNMVWDATVHNGGMCASILEHMAQNMEGQSSSFKGGYVEKRYLLMASGAVKDAANVTADCTADCSAGCMAGGATGCPENCAAGCSPNCTPVGAVTVGYYGPYFYNDSDIRFLATLNNLLILSAVLASCASIAFGIYMARRLALPINRAIGAAKKLSQGDFSGRVGEPSTTREIVDLTETVNHLAETLGWQDAQRRRLTADVAHELRTPLATLQSHLEAMIDGVWEPDAGRLKSCHEETVRLSRLVGDLERLARYESEDLALEKSRFDLAALLKRIVTNFESQFRSKGVELRFSPREAIVEADEDKLSQVFVNLISNALKYTPAGGEVEIAIADTPGQAAVSVRDTGIGIPAEDLPHIFDRFYRTDKSRSRLTGGSGIGLTIAKAIVGAHRGSIAVSSQAGGGSVFTVSLPKGRG